MAAFKDVFSTTLKVFLALVIISTILGIGYVVVVGIGAGVSSTGSSTQSNPFDPYDTRADAVRTRMPRTVWDKAIAKAIKRHCYIEGMSKQEIAQALGEPTEKQGYSSGDTWTWQLPPGKCVKYDGDKCVEQEKPHKVIFFSPNGNARLASSMCETLDGKIVFYDLFGK